MGQSYRIRTEVGVNKTINFELEQEFEFLEILSLKLNQQDIYLRACSDYGVIVGRVTANNGLGLPNARVSIFIPIDGIDESNPVISSIYPYQSPDDKNEDGYRYNLLPYEKSYSVHSATGTLPSRLDVLTGNTAIEIYDKYYKFTAKTNDSGDYMIMGVPLGEQTIVMDVDLSDIGEFSLTPQDLIRIGRATEAQVAGNRFRTSTDLNSLPQIVNLRKSVDITPLWGEPSICRIAINRVDFDLRDEANIDIQPTSVFMGSIYSTPDNFRIRPDIKLGPITISGSRPKDNFGNLCSLTSGPGQILALRQTIELDLSGNPILEQYQLEQNGNVIDESGVWLVELPMNLDYFITNEFGEKVISLDPTIGIPTKAKYRFKIKWQQSSNLTDGVRRPYYLVPNVREFGWNNPSTDPNVSSVSTTQKKQLQSSYYFGLDWSGYTNGFNTNQSNDIIDEIINCEDTFYEFKYNRVYTVAGLIDQYKNGGRGRFIGIKEIDSSDCEDTVNKFPVNEGFRNFDFLFFIVSLLLQVIQVISVPLIVVIHFVAFLIDVANGLKNLLTALFGFLAGVQIFQGISNLSKAAAAQAAAAAMTVAAGTATVVSTFATGFIAGAILTGVGLPLVPVFTQIATLAGATSAGLVAAAATTQTNAAAFTVEALKNFASSIKYLIAGILVRVLFNRYTGQKVQAISLPTLTYPDCEGCECKSTNIPSAQSLSDSSSSFMSRFSDPFNYIEGFSKPNILPQEFYDDDNVDLASLAFSQAMGGTLTDAFNKLFYKSTESDELKINKNNKECYVDFFAYSNYLPFGQRVNLFNTRKKYFDGVNKIKVTFDSDVNTNHHFDNTLSVFFETKFEAGTLLSFVNPQDTFDKNFNYSGSTNVRVGISGTTLQTGPSTYTVQYCNPSNPYSSLSTNYQIRKGCEYSGYTFPADIEYYQVLTALTISQAVALFQGQPQESLPNVINSKNVIRYNNRSFEKTLGICFQGGWGDVELSREYSMSEVFRDFNSQYLVILQRGVDPYSPKIKNKYGLGILFGSNDPDSLTITAETRLNIPIQRLNSTSMSVQPITVNGQSEIFYPSHFFRGGIQNSLVVGEQWSAFTTSNVGYYSSYDSSNNYFGDTVTNASPVQNAVVSLSSNEAYGTPVVAKYNSAEDLSGADFTYVYQDGQGKKPSDVRITYNSNVLLPSLTANPMSITSNILNVMRTDRLPSSDQLDGGSWELNPCLLQQNLGFGIYEITASGGEELGVVGYGTGANIPTQDVVGQYASTNLIDTLTVCSQIVSLQCYEGNGTGFTVSNNCVQNDSVVRGCYQFVKKPLVDIRKDIINFNEWAYRFRFFYGLCRGVLSQTFTNNWINGSLFTFPIQTDFTYNSNNKLNPPSYPQKITYYDAETRNFYFRSSPFISGYTPSEFIGRATTTDANPINQRNLLYPTTIINLGMKDSFYDEVTFDPDTNAYVMSYLNPTSYSDNSDIVNLFVLSRITNASFLRQMLNSRDNSVASLFTRYSASNPILQPRNRVDADLVQMLSINNEIGIVPFTPEYYPFYSNNPNNAVIVLPQSENTSTMGIFFSSTTEDLQIKDFISPGVIDFRFNPNVTAVTYKYGIKSQRVPFYQWQLSTDVSATSIFGGEKNNWATSINDIVTSEYQSLYRRNSTTPNYFVPSITNLDVNQRGYIFNNDFNGLYNFNVFSGMKTKFLVGAPNQFYFGVVKGASALDKFKTKYLPNE